MFLVVFCDYLQITYFVCPMGKFMSLDFFFNWTLIQKIKRIPDIFGHYFFSIS